MAGSVPQYAPQCATGDSPPAGVEPTPTLAPDTLYLSAEELSVSKETHETGRVRIATRTSEHEVLVDESLAQERVEIETVPVGRRIDVAPRVRQEGDTTIIPVVQEVLIVERHLVLKEEIRVKRIRTEAQHKESVTLRQQDVAITRSH